MDFLIVVLGLLLAFVCVILCGVVLIQESSDGGLSTAFGGGGGDALLGARGQKDLAKFTVVLTVIFLALCITVSLLKNRQRSMLTPAATTEAGGMAAPGGSAKPGAATPKSGGAQQPGTTPQGTAPAGKAPTTGQQPGTSSTGAGTATPATPAAPAAPAAPEGTAKPPAGNGASGAGTEKSGG